MTSARCARIQRISRPARVFRSRDRLSLPRFSAANIWGLLLRRGSPPGGSTLTTLAPRSLRVIEQKGPGVLTVMSNTNRLAKGCVECAGIVCPRLGLLEEHPAFEGGIVFIFRRRLYGNRGVVVVDVDFD